MFGSLFRNIRIILLLRSFCLEHLFSTLSSEEISIVDVKMCSLYVACSILNGSDPHKLLRHGNFRTCGFVGIVVALLEGMCHCGSGL